MWCQGWTPSELRMRLRMIVLWGWCGRISFIMRRFGTRWLRFCMRWLIRRGVIFCKFRHWWIWPCLSTRLCRSAGWKRFVWWVSLRRLISTGCDMRRIRLMWRFTRIFRTWLIVPRVLAIHMSLGIMRCRLLQIWQRESIWSLIYFTTKE